MEINFALLTGSVELNLNRTILKFFVHNIENKITDPVEN